MRYRELFAVVALASATTCSTGRGDETTPGAANTAGASGSRSAPDAATMVSFDGGMDRVAQGVTPDAAMHPRLLEAGGPAKQWTCPPGPFDSPVAGPAQPVCAGFSVKYGWNEGPTWIASQGAFFFSNFVLNAAGPGDMIKFTPGTGRCEMFIVDNGCNGLAVAPDGNILAACQTPRALMHYDAVTKEGSILVDMAEGKTLDSVNDVVAHSNGTIYFTNPIYELAGRPVGLGQAALRRDPLGALSVIARGPVNGIALSPDERRLYVVLQGVWDLDDQGIPSNPRSFPLGGDGIAVDCAGNIYDNAGAIRNPQGRQIGTFPAGTNMAFGGAEGKTLFIVRNTSAYTVEMNVPGLP